MATAFVGKDKTGLWQVVCRKTNKRVGGLYETELAAYKAANRDGYLVC